MTRIARPKIDAAEPGPYRLAIFLVVASSAINSVNGLLLRSIESATPWQIIAIRSAALAVALIGVFLVQQRREILSFHLGFYFGL